MSKLSIVFFLALVCLAFSLGTSSDTSKCAFVPDFVPPRIQKCAANIPVTCVGTEVCYKYTDAIISTPCILSQYGFKGMMKMYSCGFDIAYTVKPGLVNCFDEKYLRKFYACFNDGA